jgi:hypothetical protein
VSESSAVHHGVNASGKGKMGIFDKPVQSDGKLKDLEGYTFKVTRAAIRSGVQTDYGVKDAVDVYVEVDGKSYVYSGFAKGIIAQVRNADEGDFPFYATMEKIQVKKGQTLNLVPMKEGEGTPLEAPLPDELFPDASGDDDIPF